MAVGMQMPSITTACRCAVAACIVAGCGLKDLHQKRKVGPVVIGCAVFDELCSRNHVPQAERGAWTSKRHRDGFWGRIARNRYSAEVLAASKIMANIEAYHLSPPTMVERMKILEGCCREAMGIEDGDMLGPNDHFMLAARALTGSLAFHRLGLSHTTITDYYGMQTSDSRVVMQVRRAQHPVISRAGKVAMALYRERIEALERRPVTASTDRRERDNDPDWDV